MTIHLAIFHQPYLKMIFDGTKTIESRFYVNRIAPIGKIKKGDCVIMKKSGGFVVGEFTAGEIMVFENMQERDWKEIKKYNKQIGGDVDPDFWKDRQPRRHAILIKIKNPIKYKKLKKFIRKKGDRRGWVTLENRNNIVD